MYPYGSGMPNQQHNQQSPNNPPRAPFGAGFWVPSNQSQYPSNNSAPYPSSGGCRYPSNPGEKPSNNSTTPSTPYPGANSAPYPGANTAPYPGANTAPYPGANSAPYPASNSAPYPGANSAPYPGANSAPYPGANSAPYPGAHSAPYPGANSAPYPGGNSAPYPGANSATNTAPYPGANQTPYPSSNQQTPTSSNQQVPFGANQWNQSQPRYPAHNQSAYPSAGYPAAAYPHNSSSSPYTPSSTNTPYSHSSAATGYPHSSPGQGYSQNNSNNYAATNMAQCFNEMKTQSNTSYQSPIKKGTPTVIPDPNFDAVKDAHALRKAMKGFGTDEDGLINIICRRSNEQRQEIQRQYKTHFGKDLIEDVKSETSGNFENLLVGLLRPIVDFYCTQLNSAMAGIGTDEDVLIEILCTLSNSEIHTIKNAYLRMYGAHLESELKSETSGNFKRLLVSLCCAARDESGRIDPVAAQHDAKELLNAGELRVGTDESMFNMVLCQRNYQQLKLILDEYASITGHSLEKAIKREFSGDIQEGLLAICKCVTNKAEYFASRLHKSMAGIGTNDQQLIRVIITRCEIDMQDIKTAFERLYGKSLKSWVKGDTSGHYKHALYALIGEQRSS